MVNWPNSHHQGEEGHVITRDITYNADGVTLVGRLALPDG
jgi:hypothetical protein